MATSTPTTEPTPIIDIEPLCSTCGEPAACFGAYEMNPVEEFSCNGCCGHGNEDGHCRPITDEDRAHVRQNGRAMQRILSAACGAAQAAGVSIETFMERVSVLWDHIETAHFQRKKHEQEHGPPPPPPEPTAATPGIKPVTERELDAAPLLMEAMELLPPSKVVGVLQSLYLASAITRPLAERIDSMIVSKLLLLTTNALVELERPAKKDIDKAMMAFVMKMSFSLVANLAHREHVEPDKFRELAMEAFQEMGRMIHGD